MKIGFWAVMTSAMLAVGDGSDKLEYDKLRGTWLTVSLVSDGKVVVDGKTPRKPGPETKLQYDGDRWIVKVGAKEVANGTFKIDPTKIPKEMDLFDKTGVKNSNTKLAIYEITGDTYKYCVAPAGQPRPTEFASKPGSKLSLGVSKREKQR